MTNFKFKHLYIDIPQLNNLKLATLLSAILLIGACTNKELYQATQDIKCQEYHKNEDPYFQNECPKESFEEYQRKRNEVLNKNNN